MSVPNIKNLGLINKKQQSNKTTKNSIQQNNQKQQSNKTTKNSNPTKQPKTAIQ